MSSNVPSLRTGDAVGFPSTVRSSHSYPVQLELRYGVVRDGQPVEHGNGRTRQLSSSEVIFTADHALPLGLVEVALDWPVRLDGGCPLQLVIHGNVIASDQAVTVRIERHEFRTRRVPPNSQSNDRPQSHIGSLPA